MLATLALVAVGLLTKSCHSPRGPAAATPGSRDAVGLAASRRQEYGPFRDVVCRVEGEAAQILEPKWAGVVAGTQLHPFPGFGCSSSKESIRRYRAKISGGKVLSASGERSEHPLARIRFRVPETGRYFVFMKADSTGCCGDARVAVDTGPPQSLRFDSGNWRWMPMSFKKVSIDKYGTSLDLPVALELHAGEHSADILASAGCGPLLIDEVVITRDAHSYFAACRPGYLEEMLHKAVRFDKVEALRILLDLGADIDAADKGGLTPLVKAERLSRVNMARVLLDRGAATDFPLHHAAVVGDLKAISALLDTNPQAVNRGWKHGTGVCALHLAAKHGNAEVVQLLLERGAEIEKKTASGQYTALYLAVMRSRLAAAKRLVAAGADVQTRDCAGRTALHCVTNPDIAALLLDHGADPNAVNASGDTPLHGASGAVASVLLEHGADPNARGDYARTPLIAVASRGGAGDFAETAKRLLEAGAEVDAVDEFGDTALSLAVYTGQAGMVKILLASRADKDGVRGDGKPLANAAANGRTAIAKILIDAGADVNARGDDGYTPLFWAVSWKSGKIVNLLLENGADPAARGLDGNRPPNPF